MAKELAFEKMPQRKKRGTSELSRQVLFLRNSFWLKYIFGRNATRTHSSFASQPLPQAMRQQCICLRSCTDTEWGQHATWIRSGIYCIRRCSWDMCGPACDLVVCLWRDDREPGNHCGGSLCWSAEQFLACMWRHGTPA